MRKWLYSIAIMLVMCLTLTGFKEASEEDNVQMEVLPRLEVQAKEAGKRYADASPQNDLQKELISLATAVEKKIDYYTFGKGRWGFRLDTKACQAQLSKELEELYRDETGRMGIVSVHNIAYAAMALGLDPRDIFELDDTKIDIIEETVKNYKDNKRLNIKPIRSQASLLIMKNCGFYNQADKEGYKAVAADHEESWTLAEELMASSNPDGGFGVSPDRSDVETTSYVIIALAMYEKEDARIKATIEAAIEYMASVQDKNGNFKFYEEYPAKCTALAIEALTSYGIDPLKDSRFIKDGKTLYDGLKLYINKEGEVYYSYSDSDNPLGSMSDENEVAAEHLLNGLCSLYRYDAGLRSIYDFGQESKLPDRIMTYETTDEVNGLICDVEQNIQAGRTLKAAAEASRIIDRYEALDGFDKGYIDKIDIIKEKTKEDNKVFQVIIAALLLVSCGAVALLWRKTWRRQ